MKKLIDLSFLLKINKMDKIETILQFWFEGFNQKKLRDFFHQKKALITMFVLNLVKIFQKPQMVNMMIER